MEQTTTITTSRSTTTKRAVTTLLLTLATVLAVASASPALAQEESPSPSGEEAPPSDPTPPSEEATPSDQATPSGQATLSFELSVKGDPPEGTTFLGFIPAEGGIRVPLSDADGDGIYTGSVTVDRFGPGPRPVPPGTQPVSLPVQIAQDSGNGELEVIRDFGEVPINGDRTFSARVNLKRDQGDTTPPASDSGSGNSGSGSSSGAADLSDPANGVDLNADGKTDEADGEVAAATSNAAMEANESFGRRALPATGGMVPGPLLLGIAGALPLIGTFLVRKLTR